MGKVKKQNYRPFQTNRGGHFVALYDDMMESDAWGQLTANDIVLYIELVKKFKAAYIKGELHRTNENNLSMVKKEYIKLMHQASFFKSIDHLIDMGFIKVIESGYAERKCNIYGLNDMWKHYGTNLFNIKNEWKRVKSRVY